MKCKYLLCVTNRPLISYEIEMGWHVPCLNIKHKKDCNAPVQHTDPRTRRKKAQARTYQNRKQEATG